MENGQNSFLRYGCVTNRRDHKCSLWLDFYIKWIPHQLIAWNYLYSMSRHFMLSFMIWINVLIGLLGNFSDSRARVKLGGFVILWIYRSASSLFVFKITYFPVVPEWCFHSVYPSRANIVLLQKLGSFTSQSCLVCLGSGSGLSMVGVVTNIEFDIDMTGTGQWP